mgnify:CR=1 FL=1
MIGLMFPELMLANHRSGWNVDRDDLDDDPVDEFSIPILFGVQHNEVIRDFGDLRGGGTRLHEGQDMHAPQGTPIVSPTEAIVIRTGTGPSAGKYVYTANPGGETFRYMHLDDIADLDPGDELDVGDLIGTVGDTGNAPDGVYHLHFEVRDDDNDATDPYPRLDEAFTVKEKMSFLRDILRNFRSSERKEYAQFLVKTFTEDFQEALREDYDFPDEIEDAMDDIGIVSAAKLQDQLNELIASIPRILSLELENGDSGAAVQLLQLFLIYS